MQKRMEVNLRNGNPAVAEVEHPYFTRKRTAKRALRQAESGLGQVTALSRRWWGAGLATHRADSIPATRAK